MQSEMACTLYRIFEDLDYNVKEIWQALFGDGQERVKILKFCLLTLTGPERSRCWSFCKVSNFSVTSSRCLHALGPLPRPGLLGPGSKPINQPCQTSYFFFLPSIWRPSRASTISQPPAQEENKNVQNNSANYFIFIASETQKPTDRQIGMQATKYMDMQKKRHVRRHIESKQTYRQTKTHACRDIRAQP